MADDEDAARAVARLEAAAPGADVLRILVATDNHLGYRENDPVRGEDSFRTMEEIFEIGKRCHVDMAVLGGDLFHINKPTRSTMVRTMEIFRKHTRGGRDVDLLVRGQFGRGAQEAVNYEDENQAVDLPVFIIHGNHDDPTRDGGQIEALSALDLLQSNGLVNYFGRVQKMDDAVLEPVLIEKGSAKLRLYGMGWIRDERMHRMFAKGQVSFKRHVPRAGSDDVEDDAEDDDADDGLMDGDGRSARDKDWFNLFMVHQNRDFKGRGAKNCFNDDMIPAFINLVLFGHEHECLIEPQESIKNPETLLSQPGSSVATSLIPAEAQDKHVGILEIQVDPASGAAKFDLTPVRLRTVRPFVMDEITLADIAALDKDASEADKVDAVQSAISMKVGEMIEEAKTSFRELNPDATASQVKKMLPLVRLRVEHTAFPIINLQRFGDKFIGKVANPKDLVYFFKRRKPRERAAKGEAPGDEDLDASAEEISAGTRINGLIENILSGDNKLTFIPDRELHFNIQEYVEKGEAKLLEAYLDDYIKSNQELILRHNRAAAEQDDSDEDDEKMFAEDHIMDQVRSIADKRNRDASVRLSKSLDTKGGAADASKVDAGRTSAAKPSKAAKAKKSLRQTKLSSFSRKNESDASSDESAANFDDDAGDEDDLPKSKAASSRPASKRGRTAKRERDADVVLDESSDEDEVAVKSSKQSGKRKKEDSDEFQVVGESDDDDDDEDSDDAFGARSRARSKAKKPTSSKKAAAAEPASSSKRGGARSRRAAARKPVAYAESSADEIEDSADDEDAEPSSRSKRRRR